MIHVCIS